MAGRHARQLVPHEARTCPHDLCASEQLNLHPMGLGTLRNGLVWRHQRAGRPAIVAAEQQLCTNRGSADQPVLGAASSENQGTLPASVISPPRLLSAPVLLAMGPSTVMRLMPSRCSGSSGAAPATAAPWALLQPSRPLGAAQLAGGTGGPFFSSTKLCNQWPRQHGTAHQHWLRQQAHRAPPFTSSYLRQLILHQASLCMAFACQLAPWLPPPGPRPGAQGCPPHWRGCGGMGCAACCGRQSAPTQT